MSPQQALYTEILTTLRASLGYPVCDGALPPRGVTFPYVYVGDGLQADTQNKSCITGTVTQTIHVWHDDPEQRGELSSVMDSVLTMCRNLPRREFLFDVRGATQRIITDDTGTGQGGGALLHGVIVLSVTFSPVSS